MHRSLAEKHCASCDCFGVCPLRREGLAGCLFLFGSLIVGFLLLLVLFVCLWWWWVFWGAVVMVSFFFCCFVIVVVLEVGVFFVWLFLWVFVLGFFTFFIFYLFLFWGVSLCFLCLLMFFSFLFSCFFFFHIYNMFFFMGFSCVFGCLVFEGGSGQCQFCAFIEQQEYWQLPRIPPTSIWIHNAMEKKKENKDASSAGSGDW